MGKPTLRQATERFALLHSDDSMTVYTTGVEFEQAKKWAQAEDPNERRPEHRPKLARVRIELLERFDVQPERQAVAVSVAGAALIDKAQVLHCDDQFAIARAVAANVGYVLVPEPKIES